jgi:hypothetical protein
LEKQGYLPLVPVVVCREVFYWVHLFAEGRKNWRHWIAFPGRVYPSLKEAEKVARNRMFMDGSTAQAVARGFPPDIPTE